MIRGLAHFSESEGRKASGLPAASAAKDSGVATCRNAHYTMVMYFVQPRRRQPRSCVFTTLIFADHASTWFSAFQCLLFNITKQKSKTMKQHAGEYLSFQLGGEQYGHIANAPAYILGVLNLRGTIVPIVDLRIKLGISAPSYDNQTVTIVLNVADSVVGMVVDAVQDVVALKAEDIKPAPDFGNAVASQHIVGIATLSQADAARMLILMDIEQFMTSAEIGVISQSTKVIAE
jgi:purine-binding chemotaxis protein CheW